MSHHSPTPESMKDAEDLMLSIGFYKETLFAALTEIKRVANALDARYAKGYAKGVEDAAKVAETFYPGNSLQQKQIATAIRELVKEK